MPSSEVASNSPFIVPLLLTLMVLPPTVALPNIAPAAPRLSPPVSDGSMMPALFSVMPLPEAVRAAPPSRRGTARFPVDCTLIVTPSVGTT